MKIAIIGTGWGARVQVPAFRAAGLEVVAIAGSNADKTRRIATELSLRPVDDWRELLDSDADLITIVTPPSKHHEMSLAALRAGKHVLCEKPTAMNSAEAADMLREAGQHPQQLALIDHELRFLPSWREARQCIDSLGSLRYIEARFSSASRGDATREWTWWSDAAEGGGAWGAVGSHFIDAIRYFAGEVEAVQASLSTFIASRPHHATPRSVTSDDFAAVHLRLTSGVIATVITSVVAATDEPTSITIHGEGGGLRLVGDEIFIARGGGAFEREATSGEAAPQGLAGNSTGGAFGSGTWHLGRALAAADGQALLPAANFADGLAQQRVLDAARASASQNGCWVSVD